MNSMPLLLARLTVIGLTMIGLLILFVRGSTRMTSGVQRRQTTRHTVLLPVEVDGKKDLKGLTSDLSLGGCRINGHLGVKHGQYLPLRLHLPGQESPIVVERAAVRWVREKVSTTGVMSILSSERERLEGLFQWVA